MGIERLAEVGQAAWGGNADPPTISAIVEKDGAHCDFVRIETGDKFMVLDEQGSGLEEFCGVGDCANSAAP